MSPATTRKMPPRLRTDKKEGRL